ncbi:DUF4180 domain-containing protein [Devosia sp. SL43]|uniref:DUF4180 domain-containing protein n=1 Tax=Devosia sp. SL43 TaxID=2806348 RepID=UPI001F452744|nr:DUF4180 domain-containing protein [Devosia sp. SL43]UJW85278.1 DUF4180 domain-containing protein [Devosia sp. SL43]
MKTTKHNGVTLLELDSAGPLLATDQDAADLIGSTYGTDADVIVVPLARFDPKFLDLRSGIAGIFFQKLQNYRLRLVVLGDIADAIAASKSLHDFVYETNRVGNHLFAPNRQTMLARL